MCQNCFKSWLFETEEGQAYYNKTTLKGIRTGQKLAIKKQKQKRREEKEQNKSIQKLIKEARIPFHKYILLRDINNACISCRSTSSDIWDAGHFYKAELYSGLIFDEDNSHKQCRKCNTFLDGNLSDYRINLEKKIGKEKLKELDNRAIKLKSYKYTRDELIEIKKYYKEQIKLLIKNYNNE